MLSTPKRSLVRKLCEVMAAVSHVPKGGHNKAQGYDFARDVDVLAAVRAELAKRGVFLSNSGDAPTLGSFETKGGTPMQTTHVRMHFTAHDSESGESLMIGTGYGEGMDTGDKSSAKAETSAVKYGILKAFLIPTGEDPEADESVDAATGEVTPAPRPPPRQAAPRTAPADDLPATFPNFGRQKGQPIRGADRKALEFYLSASERTLDDPSKERWHDKERALMAAYKRELARADEASINGNGERMAESEVPF
jgi:hypothetical protein